MCTVKNIIYYNLNAITILYFSIFLVKGGERKLVLI